VVSFFEEQPAGGVDDSLVLGINEIDILCRGWDQVVTCSRMKGLSHGHLTARDLSALLRKGLFIEQALDLYTQV
jgi:hypothetical protein